MPYHHFTPNEQYVIAHMTIAGFSQREIGRRLGRHHTSIGREIRRNRPTYADDAVYWYGPAEHYAKERRLRPRHARRRHERLVSYVTSKLHLDWSPEAIAGRLKVDYPDNESMRICHETIYRWIYEDSRNKCGPLRDVVNFCNLLDHVSKRGLWIMGGSPQGRP